MNMKKQYKKLVYGLLGLVAITTITISSVISCTTEDSKAKSDSSTQSNNHTSSSTNDGNKNDTSSSSSKDNNNSILAKKLVNSTKSFLTSINFTQSILCFFNYGKSTSGFSTLINENTVTTFTQNVFSSNMPNLVLNDKTTWTYNKDYNSTNFVANNFSYDSNSSNLSFDVYFSNSEYSNLLIENISININNSPVSIAQSNTTPYYQYYSIVSGMYSYLSGQGNFGQNSMDVNNWNTQTIKQNIITQLGVYYKALTSNYQKYFDLSKVVITDLFTFKQTENGKTRIVLLVNIYYNGYSFTNTAWGLLVITSA